MTRRNIEGTAYTHVYVLCFVNYIICYLYKYLERAFRPPVFRHVFCRRIVWRYIHGGIIYGLTEAAYKVCIQIAIDNVICTTYMVYGVIYSM